MTDLAWMRPRLAELCGLSPRMAFELPMYDSRDETMPQSMWRPDLDAAQAVRCLDAVLQKHNAHATIDRGRLWFVEIDGGVRIWAKMGDSSFPRAICLAIAQAMDWRSAAKSSEET